MRFTRTSQATIALAFALLGTLGATSLEAAAIIAVSRSDFNGNAISLYDQDGNFQGGLASPAGGATSDLAFD